MVFSSPIFLFKFLPILLVIYYLFKSKFKNLILLLFSLIFYAWGEPKYIIVMFYSICLNYVLAILIDKFKSKLLLKKVILEISVLMNLIPLFLFKYFNFFVSNYNSLDTLFNIGKLPVLNVIMPVGISFFTFQSMSYTIDVYREEAKVEKNFINIALYVSLFPQLVAGPIVRYVDVAEQLVERNVDFNNISCGIRRFIIGFGKKIIIANNVGYIADTIFAQEIQTLDTTTVWVAVICYTLQIYYDFSGYSDMAIGLGKMFGFTFLENFNYPYISKSLTEFWRRWHISLSTWFRDYLYIPLGGNRKGVKRTYINLFIVFFATGLWHGASWNFVIWGLYHGLFLVVEKAKITKGILTNLKFIKSEFIKDTLLHIYTLIVVMIGWVFFRVDTLKSAISYISKMFIFSEAKIKLFTIGYYLDVKSIAIIIIAIFISTPVMKRLFMDSNNFELDFRKALICVSCDVILLGIFFISIMFLASSAYNPFIYYRF